MTKLRVKLRKKQEDVYPAKVLVVEITRCRLDDPVHRRTAVAGYPPAGRSLDLDRRHCCDRNTREIGLLVASSPPRLLVIGGRS